MFPLLPLALTRHHIITLCLVFSLFGWRAPKNDKVCVHLNTSLYLYLLMLTWPHISAPLCLLLIFPLMWLLCSSLIVFFSLLSFCQSILSFCFQPWQAGNQCKWGLREQIVCLAPFDTLFWSICQRDLRVPHSSLCFSLWTCWPPTCLLPPFLCSYFSSISAQITSIESSLNLV